MASLTNLDIFYSIEVTGNEIEAC